MLKEVCFFILSSLNRVLCGSEGEVRLVVVPFFVLIYDINI